MRTKCADVVSYFLTSYIYFYQFFFFFTLKQVLLNKEQEVIGTVIVSGADSFCLSTQLPSYGKHRALHSN